jgi:hypothetical protein
MHVLEALRNAMRCARTSTRQLSTLWEGVSVQWSPCSAGSNCVREIAVDHACRLPVYQARYNVTRRCFLNEVVGSGLRKIPNSVPDNVRAMGRLIKVTQIDLSGNTEIHMVRNAQQNPTPPHNANEVRLHTNAQHYSDIQNESDHPSFDR